MRRAIRPCLLFLAFAVTGESFAQSAPADASGAIAPMQDSEPRAAPVDGAPETTVPSAEGDKAPTSEELAELSRELARLTQELERVPEANRYTRRPKRQHLSASSQDAKWAPYMRAFVEKVERAGTALFAASPRGRGGSVIVTAVIGRDGSLVKVVTVTTSGDEAIDALAVAAVRAAAPFAPLPNPEQDIDELHMTRTLQFVRAAAAPTAEAD